MGKKLSKSNRRIFIRNGSVCFAGLYLGLENRTKANSFNFRNKKDDLWKWSKEAMYYEQTPRGTKCLICPNVCTLKEGELSSCNNRMNHEGKLYSIAYGNPCAVHIDPIEKKPLFHFLPSSSSYSIATAGCNLACLNCQNWTISQTSPKKTRNIDLMPSDVIKQALLNECKSIAYTYSEPITFYEYTYETSKLSRLKGLKNILVSAGYINEKPLRELCKYIDAANIDLKSFKNDIYLKLNGATLEPVLNTLKILKEENVWIEITNLIIPSWTDDMDMIKEMCEWLHANGFENYPLHFSRFHPQYKLTQLPTTPINVLVKAREIALKSGLNYVYIGNVPGGAAENTYCPNCKKLIIERKGFSILSKNISNNKCDFCKKEIAGIWN